MLDDDEWAAWMTGCECEQCQQIRGDALRGEFQVLDVQELQDGQ